MSLELIAIISAAIALAAAILPGQYAMRRDIAGLHRDIADLRERMARLEGLFEGFHPPRPGRTGSGHGMSAAAGAGREQLATKADLAALVAD